MNSINSILSPEDFTWAPPSVSQDSSQGGMDTITPPSLRQSTTFQPYEPFESLSTYPAHASYVLSNQDVPHLQGEDLEMAEDTDALNQHSAGHQDVPKPVSRRSKYGNLDWEPYKEELRKLYLEDNESLGDTMRIMKDKHAIPESTKLYKDRFKIWGWQKNLPGQYAQWMTQKAKKRKRDDGKETEFFYGGLKWDKSKVQKSALRSKKVSTGTDVIVVDTPNGIDYKTPRDDVLSPQNAFSPGRQGNHAAARQIAVESGNNSSDSEDEAQDLLLGWNGNSRSGLIAMFQEAQSCASHADGEKAERLFLTALKGYGVLLGPTHEDSTKVAIAVANFYTVQGRPNDADKVVEDLCQHHIEKFGIQHRRTQQVVLQVVELLSGCERRNDALAFLGRTKELAEANADEVSPRPKKRSKPSQRANRSWASAAAPSVKLLDATQAIIAGTGLDYGIEVARTHVAAKDEAVEPLLKAIIDHCEHDGEPLVIQNLRARSELLKFYSKLGQRHEHMVTFWNAIHTTDAIISRQKWEKDSFKSFEIMEALLEFVASVLEAGFDAEAAQQFEKIVEKADRYFGWDDERTIWAKISIGIIYQRHKTWERAKPWFDYAHAASYAANGEEDGITKSLETAMVKRHFSYVSDEGRPFKTIFGVSGLMIRPNRLHLD